MTLRGVFDEIYRTNAWNGTETRSGPGSNLEATAGLRRALLELVDELQIRSVVDAACGEGNWQPDLPDYVGLDVALEAVLGARARHPDREYHLWDVRKSCPEADLVICRDAMQHLSLADGRAMLESMRHSGSRYLFASTFLGGLNEDIVTGGAYSPDLEQPPFSMPPAIRYVADPSDKRDSRKFMGLWTLP